MTVATAEAPAAPTCGLAWTAAAAAAVRADRRGSGRAEGPPGNRSCSAAGGDPARRPARGSGETGSGDCEDRGAQRWTPDACLEVQRRRHRV